MSTAFKFHLILQVFKRVKQSFKEELPPTFGIIFDGWSCEGEHYIGVFASWVNKSGGVCERLLACGVQGIPKTAADAEDFGFTAEDIGDYIYDVLSSYSRSFDAIEFICGDNASVNRRLSQLIKAWWLSQKGIRKVIPLVGCASHRLNLAVQHLYDEKSGYHEVVEKVNALMTDLGTMKNKIKLAVVTPLNPVKRNDTRWGSTFAMLRRFLEIQPNLGSGSFSESTKAKFLSVAEIYLVNALAEQLYKCEKASIFLQKNDPHMVNLLSVRVIFDKLIEEIPELAAYLSNNSSIVVNKDFENAVVKLQKGQELTTREKSMLGSFKVSTDDENTPADGEAMSYEEEVMRSVEATRALVKKAEFKSNLHVSPTSTIVERTFSRAGIIMRPHRRHMDPSTLEMLLMLRLNKDMWSEKTIQDIIDDKNAANRERARLRAEAAEKAKSQEGAEDEDMFE